MAIPVIYKGDDTDFRGSTGFTLKVVTSSNLNLSGCTVEVEVLGFKRSFPASATGELVCPFAFSAAETQRMPLGIHAATVRVYDSKGRVRTINNSIRVKVTNNVHEAYGKDDPQEVTLAISSVDLEPYAKKDEVTAAIEKAMKDATAVKLHAITPDNIYYPAVLKPIDGAANHVGDKVRVEVTERVESVCTINLNINFWVGVDELGHSGGDLGSDQHEVKVKILSSSHDGWRYQSFIFTNTGPDIDYYVDATRVGGSSRHKIFTLPAGSIFEVEAFFDEPFDPAMNYTDVPFGNCSFNDGVFYAVYSDHDQVEYPVDLINTDGSKIRYQAGYEAPALIVAIPESADASKARKFSLAVDTNTYTEKAVEWQGGEVIEAVPGASKLVPGLNVWDVAEVAPGKFKVERASSPAQSAPLTLAAPGGRVAELAIDDDLVLEVKEI